MRDVLMQTIPHQMQRYPTCGDYYTKKVLADLSKDYIFVSSVGNEDYETLIMLHEFIEMVLTRKRKISEKSISQFDMDYECSGKKGEPGDHKDAPYRKEHKFATKIEKMMAKELGINWKKYEKTLEKLYT